MNRSSGNRRIKQDPKPAFEHQRQEAIALAERIVDALQQAEPQHIHWGHVGTMAEAVTQLKRIAAMLEPQG